MGTKIYTLTDPRDGVVKYVGKTRRDNPKDRLWQHNCLRGHTMRDNWIRKLLSLGLKPTMDIIFLVPEGDNWEKWERYWIAEYKKINPSLKNHTQGGEEGIISPQCREACIKSRLGKPSAMSGKTHTNEVKQIIKEKRKLQVISEESNRKRSLKLTGRIISAESRRKRSKNSPNARKIGRFEGDVLVETFNQVKEAEAKYDRWLHYHLKKSKQWRYLS